MDDVRWGDAPVRWVNVVVYAVGRYRMKAILVIDIADDVVEAYEDFTVDYDLRGTPKDDQKVNESIKYVEDCPLKPIPDCQDVPDTISNDVAYIIGWNDCIAEILRNENSKKR